MSTSTPKKIISREFHILTELSVILLFQSLFDRNLDNVSV